MGGAPSIALIEDEVRADEVCDACWDTFHTIELLIIKQSLGKNDTEIYLFLYLSVLVI